VATIDTAWVIGSVRGADYDVSINGGGGATTYNVAGNLYLYHPTAALSLLGKMVTHMTTEGVDTPMAEILRNRCVRLSAKSVFSVTWTSTTLRDLLGFNANLSGSVSYTAPLISPLLWSPAKPLYFELSPTGVLGNKRPLSYWTASPSDGSTFVVSHGDRTDQRFSASHVAIDRVQTASELGGEWDVLFQQSLARGHSFYVYPSVIEDPSDSSTAATISGGKGPYVYSPRGRAASWDYRRSRGFEWLNRRADITWDCRVVPEYT
jgi:hypothetical protein